MAYNSKPAYKDALETLKKSNNIAEACRQAGLADSASVRKILAKYKRGKLSALEGWRKAGCPI